MRPSFSDLVDLRTFELPGRGIRFAEPSPKLLTEHFTHFVSCIESEPYRRWILLGESLGAITATWLANELADSIRAEVIGVITVAAAPGQTGRRSADSVLDLLQTDAAELDRGQATMPMAAETIRADIKAAQAVGDRIKLHPLEVPMATIRGRDDGLVTESGARGWESLSPNGWLYREVPGNHYQFEKPTEELIAAVRSAVRFVSD